MKIRYKAAGYVRDVPEFVGRRLVARGIADVADAPRQTRDMREVTMEAPNLSAAESVNELGAANIDAMDIEALRALAKERGVAVHHRAGVEKVRSALREAEQ